MSHEIYKEWCDCAACSKTRAGANYERIYLESFGGPGHDRSWCQDRIEDDWQEYVRADLHHRDTLSRVVEELRREAEKPLGKRVFADQRALRTLADRFEGWRK